MYQIKFLKPLVLSRNKQVFSNPRYKPKPDDPVYELSTTIAVANDLGEQCFYGDIQLNVDAKRQTSTDLKASETASLVCRSRTKWTAGKRAVEIKVLVNLNQLLPGNYVSLHISLDKSAGVFDALNLEKTTIKELKSFIPEESQAIFKSCRSSTDHSLDEIRVYDTMSDLLEVPLSLDALPLKTERISRRAITDVIIYEELSGSIARHLWDAGILMNEISKEEFLSFIGKDNSTLELNFLELGTGIGLVGIHLSKLFEKSKVTATDLEDALEVCEKNISYNDVNSQVQFSELDWESETRTGNKWDFIIITDCTYNPLYYDALLNVLKRETVPGYTKVVLSHKFREPISESEFFTKIHQRGFRLEKQLWTNVFGQSLVHTGLYTL